MSVALNLWSGKHGEIKRFLEIFYEKEVKMDADVDKWICVYKKPLEAVDMISAVIDNIDKYEITVCIQVEEGDIHTITLENHNDIIKGMFSLFYEDFSQALC
jgi:hypothetical protein